MGRLKKEVSTHVQPTKFCEDTPDLSEYYEEHILGQKHVHDPIRKIVPEDMKEPYRRVIYTMPTLHLNK